MSGIFNLVIVFVFFAVLLAAALFPFWMKANARIKKGLLVLCLLTPAFALFLYAQLGAYKDLSIRDEYQRISQLAATGQQVSEADRLALMDKIRERAEASGKGEYWYLLALSLIHI